MLKWMLACCAACLLFGAGCVKKTITTATPGPQTSNATQEVQQAKADAIGQAGAGSDAELADALKRLAPEYGFSFSEENVSLVGPGTPPEGRKLPECVAEARAKLPAEAVTPLPEQIDAAAREFLTKMQEDGAKATGVTSTSTDAAPERPAPTIPKSVIGTWRTVSEQGSGFSAEHNDLYYDQMSITAEGKVGINTIRDGKLFSQDEFTYRYDAATGKMTLQEDGRTVGAFKFLTYADRPDQIYVTEEGNDITKVYENIGGGSTKAPVQKTPSGGPSPTPPKSGSK